MYSLHHIDTCTSDYFSGHHLPVIQVLVDEETTYQNIKDSLLDIYTSTDHIEDLNVEEYKEAVEELFTNFTSLNYVPDTLYNVGTFEEREENDLYMYFVLETIEEEDEDNSTT